MVGKYGPECSAQCRCVNGECSDGPFADGSCDCDDGWEGEHCEIGTRALRVHFHLRVGYDIGTRALRVGSGSTVR